MRFKALFLLLIVGMLAVAGSAQSRTNRIYRPCASSTTQARVEVQADGDIDLIPCSGRNVYINGVLTSNAFTVSGSSRTNYFPFFSTETNFAKSPLLWNGTNYLFNNTAEDSEFTLNFLPSTAAGRFRVGDFTTTATTYFDLDQSTSRVYFQVGGTDQTFTFTPGGGLAIDTSSANFSVQNESVVLIGDPGGASNGLVFTLSDLASSFGFTSASGNASMSLTGVSNFTFNRTVTAGGTTGNQTINKAVGTVNFAAGAGTSGITVSNVNVTTSSIVLAVARTNDATCSVKNVVPAAGSFVIRMNANCTAETSVGFWVMN